jgi:nucleotide-binding universal stress UspA family protein
VSTPSRWIVVPVDPAGQGRSALGIGADLARRIMAGVRVVSVVADAADAEPATARLEAMAGELTDVAVEVDVIIAKDVADAIVGAASGDAIVCMATAASLLPHQGHFGSHAEAVVRRLGRPVVLVGPAAATQLAADVERVIVPVDGSAQSEAAVERASALAALLDVPLWVVTVVTAAQQRVAAAELGPDAAAAESGYVRLLSRQAARTEDIDAQFEVLHGGDPADAILDFANPDGLVVMTTHGRSGLARLFAGSVTTSVVARSRHPVVVLRPAAELLSAED